MFIAVVYVLASPAVVDFYVSQTKHLLPAEQKYVQSTSFQRLCRTLKWRPLKRQNESFYDVFFRRLLDVQYRRLQDVYRRLKLRSDVVISGRIFNVL